MYRIDNSSAVPTLPVPGLPGTPGFFTDGNPAAALEATIVDAWWCNIIQEEILTVVTRAGLTPRKDDNTQLFQALNALFAAGGNFLPLAGGEMNAGSYITLGAPPAQPMHAANRQYVDDAVNAAMSSTGYVPEGPPGPLTYGRLSAAWNPVLPLTAGSTNPLSGPLTINHGGGTALQLNSPGNTDDQIRFGGPRQWSMGVQGFTSPGEFWIYDATAAALPLRINTAGLVIINDLHVASRAALMQVDFGASQSSRTGYINGANGSAGLDGNLFVAGWGTFNTVQADSFTRPGIFSVDNSQLWLANSITGWPSGGGRLINNWECAGRFTATDFWAPSGYVAASVVRTDAGNAWMRSSDGRMECRDFQSHANAIVNGWITAGTNIIAGGNVEGWDVRARGGLYSNALLSVAANASINGDLAVNGAQANFAGTLRAAGVWTAVDMDCGQDLVVRRSATVVGNLEVFGTAAGATNWNIISDRRIKKDIADYDHVGLPEIRRLRPVSYRFNGRGGTCDDGRVFHGLVADEVQLVMPEMVNSRRGKLSPEDPEDTDILMLDGSALTYALVNAVKELADRVETLERRE